MEGEGVNLSSGFWRPWRTDVGALPGSFSHTVRL